MITHLVDKEWNKRLLPQKQPSFSQAYFPGLQVKVNQMTVDTMKVLVSDRGLKHQVFVEHPPVVAGKLRSYINSFKLIKENIRETYPDAKILFQRCR